MAESRDGDGLPAASLEESSAPVRRSVLERIDQGLEARIAPLVVMLAFLALAFKFHSSQDLPFALRYLEDIVLAVMAGVSTGNYQYVFGELTKIDVQRRRHFLLNVFTALNILWFGLAIFLAEPVLRLSAIATIYITFSGANLRQVNFLKGQTQEKPAFLMKIEGANWLIAENGPTMLAYSSVALFIAFLTLSSKYLSVLAVEQKLVSAFAGGIAAFHLSLSVYKYQIVTRRDSLIEMLVAPPGWEDCLERLIGNWRARIKWSVFFVILALATAYLADPAFQCLANFFKIGPSRSSASIR